MTPRRFALITCLLPLLAPGGMARAQERPTEAAQSEKFDRERELEQLRAAIEKNTVAKAQLEKDIAEYKADRARLIAASIDTARKVRELEAQVGTVEARLTRAIGDEQALRQRLDAKRNVMADVLASLQRMGRRPPPALLVSPSDILKSIRSAMLLGAVLPDMRADAERLVADLEQMIALNTQIRADRNSLTSDMKRLAEEQKRLDALSAARQSEADNSAKTLEAEKLKAVGLARQAGNLELLIKRMETEIGAAMKAAEAARDAESKPGDKKQKLDAINDTARKTPAFSFEDAKGRLSYPVNGTKLRDYGDPDELGGTERGLSLAAKPGAQVVAPADGWVVFAGPFRSYGRLLIINAGGGYHIVMAGMDRISVDLGQFVLAGEPVAVMGQEAPLAASIANGTKDPVLLIELRKDGTTIDPGPWWAKNPDTSGTSAGSRNEKVRG